MKLPPLLITSSIRVSANDALLRDEGERLQYTLQYLNCWIAKFPELKVVICDGSGFDLSEKVKEQFPGSNIECLSFMNDVGAVSAFGKGYGEGEIINYALDNSLILRGEKVFAKITSKMWVKNFVQCLQMWRGNFLGMPILAMDQTFSSVALDRIDTRFYISDIDFYRKHFSKAYLRVRDAEGYFLEHSFKDVIMESKMSKFGFPITPNIEGISGSLAKDFRTLIPLDLKISNAVALVLALETTDFISDE